MLEDLSLLSERILKVVQKTRSLQAEKQVLLDRIAKLEEKYNALQTQQLRDHEEFTTMSAKLANHQQELDEARKNAAQLTDDMQTRYEQQKTRSESLQALLNSTESERDQLRLAAIDAQQQIELILERLPGAEV